MNLPYLTPRKLKELLDKFPENKILVIGDLILDRFIWGKVSRISPEAPVPVVEVERESSAVGGAANVARNIVSLRGRATLAGVIGKDSQGRSLKREIKKCGIYSEGVIIDSSRPTTIKSRVIAHQQQVVRIDKEERVKLSAEAESRLIDYIKRILKEVKAVIISDYNKGVITPTVMSEVLALAKEKRLLVAVDPKWENYKLYREPYIITPNKKEAEIISGIKIIDGSSLLEAGKRLMTTSNCQALLITQGAKGMSLFIRDKGINSIHIPTSAREVYDVTGAGDTVISSITLALCSNASFQEAAYLANLAAGLVVAKLGTATINASELLNSINKK